MDTKYFKSVYLMGVLLFILLQGLDVVVTYFNVNHTRLFMELNPFMAPYVSNLYTFVLLKGICLCIVVVTAEALRRMKLPWHCLAIIWLVVGFSAAVMWSNVMQMMILL